MYRVIACMLLLWVIVITPDFLQSKYKVVFERADIARHTTKYKCRIKVRTFKYNRTDTAFNISFHTTVEYGEDLNIVVQAYKFASNEYREFPMRFGFNFCDKIRRNDFGIANVLKCGNFTGCPMGIGDYTICNFAPDYSKFPPYIPSGSYMVELQLMYLSTEIAMIRGYGSITYPIV